MAETIVPPTAVAPLAPAAPAPQPLPKPGAIGILQGLLLVLIGAAAFNAAFMVPAAGPLIALFLFCAAKLARQRSAPRAFFLALFLGILAYIPQAFYAAGGVSPTTTLVMVLWPTGAATVIWLGHQAWSRIPGALGLLILPIAWLGLEYLLCEIAPPQWGWLAAGMAMPPEALHHLAGVYGLGFVLMLIAALCAGVRGILGFLAMLVVIAAAWGLTLWQLPHAPVEAAAATMHTGSDNPAILTLPGHYTARTVAAALDAALKDHPQTDIILLTSYSLSRNDAAIRWARDHKKDVITAAQGKVDGPIVDTLIFTDTTGATGMVFNRGIGADAPEDSTPDLADSPWGKIALLPFHDLAHRAPTDRLIAAGARALIVLNPDVEANQVTMREDRTRLAQIRAAEYAVPLLRATSDGRAQLISPAGQIAATAAADTPLAVTLPMASTTPAVPIDHVAAPVCLALAGIYGVIELLLLAAQSRKNQAARAAAVTPSSPPPDAPR